MTHETHASISHTFSMSFKGSESMISEPNVIPHFRPDFYIPIGISRGRSFPPLSQARWICVRARKVQFLSLFLARKQRSHRRAEWMMSSGNFSTPPPPTHTPPALILIPSSLP